MSERPIIFNAPMVRAILDGSKTQTRRVIKPQMRRLDTAQWFPGPPGSKRNALHYATEAHLRKGMPADFAPWKAGDRLWVRESGWEPVVRSVRQLREGADTWPKYEYDADGITESDAEQYREWGWKRRPSIHMPRWASRLTLEVQDVRVQRLKEISEEDIDDEGVVCPGIGFQQDQSGPYGDGEHIEERLHSSTCCRKEFARLWNEINGKRGYYWNSDPWVWAITFSRREQV